MHTIGHRSNPFCPARFGSATFHRFTSFNVCLNFFIEWTILKFSACFGKGFSITFFGPFSSLFSLYEFLWMFALFSPLKTIVVEKEKKKKKKKSKKHKHTLAQLLRNVHIADHSILMTTNPFLAIRIVMVTHIVYKGICLVSLDPSNQFFLSLTPMFVRVRNALFHTIQRIGIGHFSQHNQNRCRKYFLTQHAQCYLSKE